MGGGGGAVPLFLDGQVVRQTVLLASGTRGGVEAAGGLQDARRAEVSADGEDQLAARIMGDGNVVEIEEDRLVLVAGCHRPRCGEATDGPGGAAGVVPRAGRVCG